MVHRRGWWGFDKLPRRNKRPPPRRDLTKVAGLFQLPPADPPTPGIVTPWCDEHDLPMRLIRTRDDGIVCWFVWTYLPDYRFGIRACIEGSRLVSPLSSRTHPPT